MKKYMVYSYEDVDRSTHGRLTQRQREVGRFDNRAAADRAAWDALIGNPALDSVQVVLRTAQVYHLDRESLTDGAAAPPGEDPPGPATGAAGLPPAWADLLTGLALLARGRVDDVNPVYCDEGTLTVLSDPELFTPDELARLRRLGFVGTDGDATFISPRFGNA